MSGFNPPRILWSGGLNSTSITLRLEADVQETVTLFKKSDLQTVVSSIELRSEHIRINKDILHSFGVSHALAEIQFSSLFPDTEYALYLKSNAVSNPLLLGKFRSFPSEGNPYNFTFSAASCAKWQSSASSTYLDIFSKDPLFFISTGDLFYGDINANNTALYIQQYLSVLQVPIQKSFFSQISTFYIFDDHDFSNNDSNGMSSSKNASLEVFDQFYPHYPLYKDSSNSILGFQSFTVGRVRFFITDLRSKSTGPISDLSSRTTLGSFQRNLLLQELSGFRNYELMVWVSTKPWSGANYTGSEDWSDYAEERAVIANHISNIGVNNLVMIAGDAHMIAADDGSHTDFSTLATGNGAGFPLFHSAPMAQYGSSKGGSYSLGCFGYLYYPNYQYSMFTITDSNTSICLQFDGYAVPSQKLVSYTACRNTLSTSSILKKAPVAFLSNQTCRLPWFPAFVWVLMSLGVLLIFLLIFAFIFKKKLSEKIRKMKQSRKRPVSAANTDVSNANLVSQPIQPS